MKSKNDEVKEARDELVEMGLVRDSGRRRNGQIVWVLTPLGAEFAKTDDKEIH